MSLPSINFLHLTVSEIQPGQTFSRRLPIRTPWVKTINDIEYSSEKHQSKFGELCISCIELEVTGEANMMT